MQTVKKTLTTAQILALNATPIELAPAPGSGKILIPVSLVVSIHFNSVAFAAGSAVDLYLGPKANGKLFASILAATINAAANTADEEICVAVNVNGLLALFENQNLNLQTVGAAFTTGDGSITVTLFYNTGSVS